MRQSAPPPSMSRESVRAASCSPGEQRGGLVAIQTLPSQRFQRRNQRVFIRQQGMRETELIELSPPAWPQLRQPGVLFEKLAAVKIAAAVEEYLARPLKSIDEISAELVRREDAGARGQLLDLGGRRYRELIGRKAGARRDG